MASPSLRPLPYLQDSGRYFAALRERSRAVWLDSGAGFGELARYDILSAAPRVSLITRGTETRIITDGKERRESEDPLALLAMELSTCKADRIPNLPFCGGAIGYFGYHLHEQLEPLNSAVDRDIALPDMAVGIYDWAVVLDHHRQTACLAALPGVDSRKLAELEHNLLAAASAAPVRPGEFQVGELRSNVDLPAYKDCLARIRDYILAGDCYQVNFAQRFSGDYRGDPFAAYCHLRKLLPAPYGAYLELEDSGAILSHSPEQFLRLRDGQVETRPIKGTAARHPDPEQDRAAAHALCESTKDRAENLMIVDLLRNDLGKVCRFGSVSAPELFRLESHANVHHLVSTVSGHLRDGSNALDLLRACFPGGSITGAPKRRSMEIIAELEQCDRSVYCGSVAYIDASGDMDSSIVIRSLTCSEGRIHCWGGGGIVADSDPDAEYAESLSKIRVLLEGLKRFLAAC